MMNIVVALPPSCAKEYRGHSKINSTNHFMSCCNCNKKISSLETKVVECTSCGLKQRPASWKKYWYLQALFQQKKGTLNLLLFDDTLKQVHWLPNVKFESITQDELDDKF